MKAGFNNIPLSSYFDKVSGEIFEHNPRRNQSRPRLRIQSKYSPLNPPVRRLSRKITSQGEAPADAHQEQNIEFPDVERWSLQQCVQQGEATAGTDDSLDQRSMELSSINAPHPQPAKVRSIDTGKFHTTLIEGVISASGGFSLLYTLLERPAFYIWEFYVLLLMGVCWCFALGCNLAAEPANRRIERTILGLNPKPGSRLVSSRIMLEDFAGHLIEV